MSPGAMDIVGLLHRHDLRVFSTTDFRTLTGLSPSAATQALRRLAQRELVLRLKRSVWINRLADVNPHETLPFLTAPWPSYVSLYSALSQYGVVAEIPHVLYGVTSGPPARYKTSIGDFSLHHLPSRLIWGYESRREGRASYLIAEPEKAFLDLVYLALIPRSSLRMPHKRGRRWALDADKLKKYAVRFKFPPLLPALKRLGVLTTVR